MSGDTFNYRTLSPEELEVITARQKALHTKFRNVPPQGVWVKYLGKKFIVHKNVFWPFEDSQTLVEALVIHPGEEVLDIGSGSGVIAIFAASKGAGKVVAVDINPEAVENTKVNAQLHGFSHIIDVRLSDMFAALKDDEKFDVVTANLPFRNLPATDLVELSTWDTNLHAHRTFFAGIDKHLRSNGRVYMAQSNYGAIREMKTLAEEKGFSIQLLKKKELSTDKSTIFYAFELRR